MSGKPQTITSIIKSVIRQRKMLIREGKSYKNVLVCHEYIKKFSMYVEAYEKKWTEEAWKRFLLNNVSEIIYLIPENRAGLTIKQKIYESL